jgi:hypothetical protein
MIDVIYLLVVILIIALVILGARNLPVRTYSLLMLFCMLLSVAAVILYNELYLESSSKTPLHSALLSVGQYGALTLSAKVWFSINYDRFTALTKIFVNCVVYGAFLVLVLTSYWIQQQTPLLMVLLYPLGSISLALLAESIEEKLRHPTEK